MAALGHEERHRLHSPALPDRAPFQRQPTGSQLQLGALEQTVPFKVKANQWYVLKTKVTVNDDGSGLVQGKVWDKTAAEPEAWTIEVEVPVAHKNGSPGLFGFTPLNQKRVYLDNLSVVPNK